MKLRLNNQFPEFADSVFARYKKTTVHGISGVRLDPHNESKRISFLLQSAESDFNFTTKALRFNYSNDVIELYSEREVRLFEILNKTAIEQGVLVPYEDTAPAIDRTNTLTDSDLDRLARTPQRKTYESRIANVTSTAQLRALRAMLPENAPIWKLSAIDTRLKELE